MLWQCFQGRELWFRWVAVALAALAAARAAAAQPSDPDIARVLAAMQAAGEHFDPVPLQVLGRRGLAAVLDHLLPETAKEKDSDPSKKLVAELIAQLGHESYQVRESATGRLLAFGPAAKPLLLEATAHSDAEIRWRVTRILRKWAAQRPEENLPLVAALTVYLQGLEDDECLAEVSGRTVLALGRGTPEGARAELLWQCLMAVARSGKEPHANTLLPLLKHPQPEVAVLVVERIGSVADRGFFPPLMREALRSPRAEIAAAAMRQVPHCRNYPGEDEVRRCLIGIFEGSSEPLKFQACYPLMRSFQYAPAIDYLLAQTRSEQPERRARAFGWLGDPANLGRPATPKLLSALRPLLASADDDTRRLAAGTLAMYSGEEVVRSLIPLLDDPKAIIADEIGYRIRHQRDTAMLRRVLTAAAKDNPNENIRKRIASVLEKLDEGD